MPPDEVIIILKRSLNNLLYAVSRLLRVDIEDCIQDILLDFYTKGIKSAGDVFSDAIGVGLIVNRAKQILINISKSKSASMGKRTFPLNDDFTKTAVSPEKYSSIWLDIRENFNNDEIAVIELLNEGFNIKEINEVKGSWRLGSITRNKMNKLGYKY